MSPCSEPGQGYTVVRELTMARHYDIDPVGLRIEMQTDGDRRVLLQARGDVDTEDVPTLRTWLDVAIGRRPKQTVLDLRQVTYLGSAGPACLVLASLHARTAGSALCVVATRQAVTRPIQSTGRDTEPARTCGRTTVAGLDHYLTERTSAPAGPLCMA